MILNAKGDEVNGNGVSLTDRQQAKYMAQNATLGECNDIAIQHAIRAVNHLGNQIPAKVQEIVNATVSAAIQGFYESLRARGMLLEPKEILAADPVEAAAAFCEQCGEDCDCGPDFTPVPKDQAGGFLVDVTA